MKKFKYKYQHWHLAILAVVFIALYQFGFLSGFMGAAVNMNRPDAWFIYFKDKPSQIEKDDVVKQGGQHRFSYVDQPKVISVQMPEHAINVLKEKNKNIDHVEKVQIAEVAMKSTKSEVEGRRTKTPPATSPPPAPTYQPLQWGVKYINSDLAWATTKGAGVTVAVLDTGVYKSHPDLAQNIVSCTSMIGTDCIDTHGHGTHVAGIILAVNNGIGVVGVAPEAKLMSIQVCDSTGACYADALAKGIEQARLGVNGVKANIISMSLGGNNPLGTAVENEIKSAYTSGITLVVASGNTGGAVQYPAVYPEVIAVGAIDSPPAVASWSSRGPELDVVAPGLNIYSTWINNYYAGASGTSMACPHASGVVALMLSKTPGMTPEQVRTKLTSSATDMGAVGFDVDSGYGIVNAKTAIS